LLAICLPAYMHTSSSLTMKAVRALGSPTAFHKNVTDVRDSMQAQARTESNMSFSSLDRTDSILSMAGLSEPSGGLAGRTFTFTASAEEPKVSWGSCCNIDADFRARLFSSVSGWLAKGTCVNRN